MHSDLEQAQREEVMKEFKNGHIDILVATDVVARGIDINDIRLVVNFDIPHDPSISTSPTTRRITFTASAVPPAGRMARGWRSRSSRPRSRPISGRSRTSWGKRCIRFPWIPRSARCPNMSPRNTVRVRRGGDARGDRRPSGSASGKRSFSALRSGSASRKRSFSTLRRGSVSRKRSFSTLRSGSASRKRSFSTLRSGSASRKRSFSTPELVQHAEKDLFPLPEEVQRLAKDLF